MAQQFPGREFDRGRAMLAYLKETFFRMSKASLIEDLAANEVSDALVI